MKNDIKKCAAFLFSLITTWSMAQSKIDYGSNNGKYVTRNGIKIYYEEYGEGASLLLLHGGLTTMSGFGGVIPELSKHFRVIAIDNPGEGRSELAENLSHNRLAIYVSKMIDLLKLDSTYIFGYSSGGIIALHLAAERSDKVKMVVAESIVLKLSDFVPESQNFLTTVTPEIIEANLKLWLEDHQKKTPQKDGWKKYINDFRGMWSVPGHYISEVKLQNIKIPVLILQGDQDITTPDHGLYIHQLIPKSQFGVLPGTTHFVLWERPDIVSRTVLDFLLKKKPTGRFEF